VLDPYRQTGLTGIFHSFTGTAAEAEQILAYERFKIGVNGVFTFKQESPPRAVPRGHSPGPSGAGDRLPPTWLPCPTGASATRAPMWRT